MTTAHHHPQRLLLFGGSFDPIHFGHLISARSMAEQLGAHRIVLIPAARPPHKVGRQLAPAHHRLEMACRAVAADPLFEVSDLEIGREGPSYTIDTVTQFRASAPPDAELIWMIGSDSLPELANWHRIAELAQRITIATATRPRFDLPDLSALIRTVGRPATDRIVANCRSTPAIDISSTDLRERVAANKPINYLTHDAVIAYIDQQRLYRE